MIKQLAFVSALGTFLLAAPPSQANITVTGTEDASGVTFSFSGTLDVTGLVGPSGAGGIANFVSPANASFGSGGNSGGDPADTDLYTSAFSSLPTSFGSGGFTAGTSITPGTDTFLFSGGSDNFLVVPGGYTSGLLSGSSFYQGATFDSLGIDVDNGPYVFTLANTAANTITLDFGSQPIPEPLTMLGASAAIAFGTAFKRRQHKA